MDELEQRLTNVLTKVSESADPAAARLRNPATAPRREASRLSFGRRHTTWPVAVASGVAVAAVAVGIAVGIPRMTRNTQPAASTGPAESAAPTRGKTDGTHPLWALGVTEKYPHTFDQLVTGEGMTVPVPYTIDPELVPELTKTPTLVTKAGEIKFPGSTAVHLLGQRDAGVFIAVTGAGGGDGLHDVDFQLVAADNTRRTLHHAAQASSVAVSPDGTMLALSTWLGKNNQQGETAVELVDVASGRVTHQLAGRFTQVAWASDTALVLGGNPGEATSLAWRAPWSDKGEQIPVRAGSAMTVAGGMVALDHTTGCLQKLDADATVTAANCYGWRAAGHVSPDGRNVSLEWASGSTTQYGVLAVSQNQVRSWPVPGMNPSWLGPADVLLTEDTAEDTPRTARCDLTANTCALAPDDISEGLWRGAAWIGS
jgi:hypothetical protein